MSLTGALRRRRAGHIDLFMRKEAENLSEEAVYAIGRIRPGQSAAAIQLINVLVTMIGDPAVTEATNDKIYQITRAEDARKHPTQRS